MYSSANNICRVRPKDAKLGVRSLVASVAIETEAAMNSKENLSPGRIADTVQAYDSFRDDDETIEERVLPVLLPATLDDSDVQVHELASQQSPNQQVGKELPKRKPLPFQCPTEGSSSRKQAKLELARAEHSCERLHLQRGLVGA